jgi:hypothetical protein
MAQLLSLQAPCGHHADQALQCSSAGGRTGQGGRRRPAELQRPAPAASGCLPRAGSHCIAARVRSSTRPLKDEAAPARATTCQCSQASLTQGAWIATSVPLHAHRTGTVSFQPGLTSTSGCLRETCATTLLLFARTFPSLWVTSSTCKIRISQRLSGFQRAPCRRCLDTACLEGFSSRCRPGGPGNGSERRGRLGTSRKAVQPDLQRAAAPNCKAVRQQRRAGAAAAGLRRARGLPPSGAPEGAERLSRSAQARRTRSGALRGSVWLVIATARPGPPPGRGRSPACGGLHVLP